MKAIFALAAAAFLFSAGFAEACDCVGYTSAAAQAENSDAIFRGRVIETRSLDYVPGAIGVTTFEVISTLKLPGELGRPRRIEVIHDCSGIGERCAISFREGEEYLVAATFDHRHRLTTSLCHAPRWSENEYRAALNLTRIRG